MDFATNFAINCNMILELRGPDGELKERRDVHNAVTTNGKYGVADQILDTPTLPKMGWMAIGTGTPAANALGAETARVAFTSKLRTNAIVTVVGTFGAGVGTGAITEAGTFDTVAVGNMWMSASFAVINKGAADSLAITWTLTVS